MRHYFFLISLSCLLFNGLSWSNPPTAPTQKVQFRILWSGATGGVSGHVGRNRGHLALGRVGALSALWEGPVAFEKDGLLLFHPDRLTVGQFTSFLGAAPFKKFTVASGLKVGESPFELVFAWPDRGDSFLKTINAQRATDTQLTGQSYALVRFVNAEGATVFGLETRPGVSLLGPPTAWETRFMFKGEWRQEKDAQTIYSIGRPVNDGARRVMALKGLQAEGPVRTITLSAGNDLETVSFLDPTKPDGQRAVTWDAWAMTKLDVLVPAASELIFGVPRLVEMAKKQRIPLVSANLEVPGILPWRLFEHGGAQLLIIGVTDGNNVKNAVDITPPAAGVERAVQASTAQLGRRPDVVLVIGHLTPASRAALERDSDQIDFLITDFADHGIHGEAITQVASGQSDKVFRSYERHPITIVRAGRNRLGLLDLTLRRRLNGVGYVIDRVLSKALPVYGSQRPDPSIAKKVQAVRQAAYGQGQAVVLPTVRDAIDKTPAVRALFDEDPVIKKLTRGSQRQLGRLSPRLWRALCVRVFRDAIHAQVALLPHFPVPWALSGPVTRLQISANTPLPASAVVVNVDAKTMVRLMTALRELNLVTSGLELRKGLIRGRKIDLRMSYDIAIPDDLRQHSALASILGKGKMTRRFTLRDGGYTASGTGKEIAVGRVITTAFSTMTGLPPLAIVGRIIDDGTHKTARWLLEANDINLGTSRYSTHGEQAAYANVRESRVVTQNNRSIGVGGEFNLLREGTDLNWSNRARFGFDKAYYEDAEDQETRDELRFTTELQLPLFGLLSGVPYGSVAYATEFTPTETDEGDNPRKKQIEGNLGLAWKYKKLRISRLGLLVTRDFAAEINDPQLGFNGSTDLRFPTGRITWFAKGEARYFVPDLGRDDDTELGLSVAARAGVQLKLFRGFSLSIYGDGFFYRGQVEQTSALGSSLIGGLALTYDQRIRLAGE